MGNCQAAEAATVVIVHPGCKIQRIYWSVSANEVMTSYPGHYVALIITSPTAKSENGTPLKQLKLLRPDDTLHIGQVYRLISFEEVLKEFAAKKCAKLGRLLKETGRNSAMENRKERIVSKLSSDLERRKERGDSQMSSDLEKRKERGDLKLSSDLEKRKERGNSKLHSDSEKRRDRGAPKPSSDLKISSSVSVKVELEGHGLASSSSSRVGRHQHYQGGQWRPALQSIAEIGN